MRSLGYANILFHVELEFGHNQALRLAQVDVIAIVSWLVRCHLVGFHGCQMKPADVGCESRAVKWTDILLVIAISVTISPSTEAIVGKSERRQRYCLFDAASSFAAFRAINNAQPGSPPTCGRFASFQVCILNSFSGISCRIVFHCQKQRFRSRVDICEDLSTRACDHAMLNSIWLTAKLILQYGANRQIDETGVILAVDIAQLAAS